MKDWLVWSHEHGAYWGPNHRGYPIDINLAGRYSLEEAVEICRSARSGRPDERPPELPVPSPECIERLQRESALIENIESIRLVHFHPHDKVVLKLHKSLPIDAVEKFRETLTKALPDRAVLVIDAGCDIGVVYNTKLDAAVAALRLVNQDPEWDNLSDPAQEAVANALRQS